MKNIYFIQILILFIITLFFIYILYKTNHIFTKQIEENTIENFDCSDCRSWSWSDWDCNCDDHVGCRTYEYGHNCDKNTGVQSYYLGEHGDGHYVACKNTGCDSGCAGWQLGYRTRGCLVNCEISGWTDWTACDPNTGKQFSDPIVQFQPRNGGQACPPRREQNCKVDCKVSGWTDWSECDPKSGKKYSNPVIEIQPKNGGEACPTRKEEDCKVDCKVSGWTDWSKCDEKTGKQFSDPIIENEPKNGGEKCPERRIQNCDIDCDYKWGDWSNCDPNTGKQFSDPIIKTPALNNGKICPERKYQDCKVDCAYNWGEYSDCNPNTGKQFSDPIIKITAKNGGEKCPDRRERNCSVDCVYKWDNWSVCDPAIGRQFSDPKIEITAKNGGNSCPERRNRDCIIDCDFTWGEWSKCDFNNEKQYADPIIKFVAKNGGAECPTKKSKNCAIDCEVSGWTEWSKCDFRKEEQYRDPIIAVKPSKNGKQCPTREIKKCAIDCEISGWTDWTKCDINKELQFRDPVISVKPSKNGKKCPTKESKKCAIDCEISGWTDWTECDRDNEEMYRNPIVKVRPSRSGKQCPPVDSKKCTIDCEVSNWMDWEGCNKKCGGGIQKRRRNVVVPPSLNGKACPPITELRDCNKDPCPVDCQVSGWTNWSDCSKDCKGGKQIRKRKVLVNKNGEGKECPVLEETRDCNVNIPCPVDCKVSEWGKWSGCDASCGEKGTQERTRKILVNQVGNGEMCPILRESKECSVKSCPIDCEVSDWSSWSKCTKPCDGGVQERTRTIIVNPNDVGKVCPNLVEKRACNEKKCPIDCKISDWSEWSECSKKCGGGERKRTRKVLVKAEYEGDECGVLEETGDCSMDPCPIDCVVGEWGNWSNCSEKCGGGIQKRTREIKTQSQYGGKKCPILSQSKKCNEDIPCPVDCEVSNWSPFTDCSAPCGGGTQVRVRRVLVKPKYGGEKCPELMETHQCNTQECPVDCRVSGWSNFSECSKTCGGGIKTRTRKVITKEKAGGKECPELIEQVGCNEKDCPKDCKVSEWSGYGPCSKPCGGGVRVKSRDILEPSIEGGKKCPKLIESETCNEKSCEIDCEVTEWGKWSDCSSKCGDGIKMRTRKVKVEPKLGGKLCPNLTEIKACKNKVCDIPEEEKGFKHYTLSNKPVIQKMKEVGPVVPSFNDLLVPGTVKLPVESDVPVFVENTVMEGYQDFLGNKFGRVNMEVNRYDDVSKESFRDKVYEEACGVYNRCVEKSVNKRGEKILDLNPIYGEGEDFYLF